MLHPGQIPIRIFTDQLVVVAFEQNLQALEDQIVSAIDYLEEAQFMFQECRSAWGETYMDQEAQDVCAENIAAINEEEKEYRSIRELKDKLRQMKNEVRVLKNIMNIPHGESDASLSDIESNDGKFENDEEDTPCNINDDDD